MTEVTIQLEDTAAAFYNRIAAAAGLPLSRVLSDALFKLAGELSLQSLKKRDRGHTKIIIVFFRGFWYTVSEE